MCIIIDANVLSKFLADPPSPDAGPIHNWINNMGGTIIFSTGGKFNKEIGRHARNRLQVLVRRNVARQIPLSRFQDDEKALQGKIKSDDEHILALARSTGARILYTSDKKLIEDFKDKEIIDQPRGKIYSNANNSSLLTKNTCN